MSIGIRLETVSWTWAKYLLSTLVVVPSSRNSSMFPECNRHAFMHTECACIGGGGVYVEVP